MLRPAPDLGGSVWDRDVWPVKLTDAGPNAVAFEEMAKVKALQRVKMLPAVLGPRGVQRGVGEMLDRTIRLVKAGRAESPESHRRNSADDLPYHIR